MTAQHFSSVVAGDQVCFHQFHRWFNPLARERATLFTTLRPDEIRDRLWPYLDQSHEPDAKKEFLDFANATGSILTALPRMTGEERRSGLEQLGRLYRDDDLDGFSIEGSAHADGFSLWHERKSSV